MMVSEIEFFFVGVHVLKVFRWFPGEEFHLTTTCKFYCNGALGLK